MKNRESIKNKLQNTDDETLKQLILTVANASGRTEDRKRSLINDIPTLRRLLSETNDDQLSALIASMGIVNAADALRKLNSDKK